MKKTALERLRDDELRISRQEMADRLNTGRSNIEKYEAVITEDLAAKCLEIVRQEGLRHLEQEFMMLAGRPVPSAAIDLNSADAAEKEFLKKCLGIYRDPKTDMQKGIPAFIEAISAISEGK